MEQRAKEMGKKSAAGVYRRFINSMKKKTKKKNEGWSKKYKKVLIVIIQKGFHKRTLCREKEERKQRTD